LCDGDFQVVEADFGIRLVACAGFVLVCAVVLDLFAVILDLGQTECCATTLEEVTEGTELGEVLLLTVVNRVSLDSCVCTPLIGRGSRRHAHVLIHLVECAVGLLEEIEDDTPAEFSLIFIVVHFEDLLKGCDIDVVAKVAKADGTVLALFAYVLAPNFSRMTRVAAMYLDFSCRHFGVS